jgi:hypothetical protein
MNEPTPLEQRAAERVDIGHEKVESRELAYDTGNRHTVLLEMPSLRPSPSGFSRQDRRAWLLAIGQRLQFEYSVLELAVPGRLAALIKQLQLLDTSAPQKVSRRNIS